MQDKFCWSRKSKPTLYIPFGSQGFMGVKACPTSPYVLCGSGDAVWGQGPCKGLVPIAGSELDLFPDSGRVSFFTDSVLILGSQELVSVFCRCCLT